LSFPFAFFSFGKFGTVVSTAPDATAAFRACFLRVADDADDFPLFAIVVWYGVKRKIGLTFGMMSAFRSRDYRVSRFSRLSKPCLSTSAAIRPMLR
jgi:hypothetical protein